MVTLKRYKLKLNSIDKIEELLQELYNESCKIIEETQTQINKLNNSINLNDEITDSKAKYAKAINDFINSKDKAIGRKLEIAKLMGEIYKFNGNAEQALNEGDANVLKDWEYLKEKLVEEEAKNKQEYLVK